MARDFQKLSYSKITTRDVFKEHNVLFVSIHRCHRVGGPELQRCHNDVTLSSTNAPPKHHVFSKVSCDHYSG